MYRFVRSAKVSCSVDPTGRDSKVLEGQAPAPKTVVLKSNTCVCVVCVRVPVRVPTCIGLRSTLDVVCFFFVLMRPGLSHSLSSPRTHSADQADLKLHLEIHLPLPHHC